MGNEQGPKVEAVILRNVVAAEVAVGEQVVGAVQDRLGGFFIFHGAGELTIRINHSARVKEPRGHCVGEEAKLIPSQEAVKAVDDDAASKHLGQVPSIM
jgi:hypothetical protein